MARRILVHFIESCDGAGCEATRTVLGDGREAGQAVGGDKRIVVKMLPEEPNNAFHTVRVGGSSKTLCAECNAKLQGVFKAEIQVAPPPHLAIGPVDEV